MKKPAIMFKITYLIVFVLVVFLTVNLALDIVSPPNYLLPVMLVIGALMFFLRAMIRRKAQNKRV